MKLINSNCCKFCAKCFWYMSGEFQKQTKSDLRYSWGTLSVVLPLCKNPHVVLVSNQVKDYGTFYRWLEETLIPSYYSTPVYDGERHWWTTNFTADYNSVPVGIPRLRQLRTLDCK